MNPLLPGTGGKLGWLPKGGGRLRDISWFQICWLQVREDGTGTSANGIRNQRLTHANSMSDKDCKVIGGSSEENGADKVHNKGLSGRA